MAKTRLLVRTDVTRATTLRETDAHHLLSSQRRCETLRVLARRPGGEPVALRELSERVAAAEAGETPAPRPLRRSVYNALHQTHLPTLAGHGFVDYDPVRKRVLVRAEVRDLVRYMDTVTPVGVTWGEYYRGLGIGGLCLVVAALAELPVVGRVDPLLWASGALVLFAVSTLYQLFAAPVGGLRGLAWLLADLRRLGDRFGRVWTEISVNVSRDGGETTGAGGETTGAGGETTGEGGRRTGDGGRQTTIGDPTASRADGGGPAGDRGAPNEDADDLDGRRSR
ncbi:hypothetical protein RYH80_16030 [Halobaculum sp. MBLA0147]|uniref:DUF7344 domain-containing protein n=1 Tax=Halobaculum sp. MBLA0147 TaxID=3079934 RepID=UPI003523D130